jgi:hypothetical protein
MSLRAMRLLLIPVATITQCEAQQFWPASAVARKPGSLAGNLGKEIRSPETI